MSWAACALLNRKFIKQALLSKGPGVCEMQVNMRRSRYHQEMSPCRASGFEPGGMHVAGRWRSNNRNGFIISESLCYVSHSLWVLKALPHACKINVCAADVSDPLPQPSMGSAAFPEHLDHSEDAVLVSLPDPW